MVDWIPEKRDIIWINCSPQAGQEIPDLHPLLVLSPKKFNAKTSIVIGLPMTTAKYNKNNPFALNIGKVDKGGSVVDAYILCHQVKSFDWVARSATPHNIGKLEIDKFNTACAILNQIIKP